MGISENERRLLDDLIGVVEPCFPRDAVATSDADAWPLVGAGLLAHSTLLARGILTLGLADADVEAMRLARSLADHTIAIAGIASDPQRLLPLWRKSDVTERLRSANDARELGVRLASEEVISDFKRQRDDIEGAPLGLAQLAVAADKFWGGLLPGITAGTPLSFRGFYAFAFRNFSGVAHATMVGLNRITEERGPNQHRVHLASVGHSHKTFGVTCLMFGTVLIVAEASLGFPPLARHRVSAAYQRFPIS